jgi:hypothetical protein
MPPMLTSPPIDLFQVPVVHVDAHDRIERSGLNRKHARTSTGCSTQRAERDTQHERQHPLRKVNAFQYRRRIALPPVYTHTQHERHSTQTASFLVGQCTSASSKDSSTISTQQARRSTQTTSSPIDQYNPTSSKDSSTTNVLARSSQFTTTLHFKSLPHLTSTTFTCEVSE